ncbi:hypothetical protein JTB14_018145 [Gonioctena quinquepunctata]|nr:hypothetical protein JTB14_018145 [Gonioctena quinquepunctata]
MSNIPHVLHWNQTKERPYPHSKHTLCPILRSTAVVVVVESVLEGIHGWSQDYVVSKRVPLVEDSIGEEMLSDGGSESFLKKLRAVAAESLVNVQGKDVAQIHGEGITEDFVTLDEVFPLSSFFQGWQI